MSFETKMRFNAGSMITVIPKSIVDLLNLEHGDTVIWDIDLSQEGAQVGVKVEGKMGKKNKK